MKATEIRRVPVVTDGIAQLSADVAAKAKTMFSYVQPYTPNSLGSLLKKVEIEPFNIADVARYKTSKVSRTISNIAWMWMALFVAIATTFIALLVTHAASWVYGVSSISVVVSLCICGIISDQKATRRKVSEWRREPIQYFGYIPEFALAKAIQLRELNPSVQFQVDYLDTHEQVTYPDPFLVAILGKEEYYIDVWDEPEFERQTRG